MENRAEIPGVWSGRVLLITPATTASTASTLPSAGLTAPALSSGRLTGLCSGC
jgi:hypothetical protein